MTPQPNQVPEMDKLSQYHSNNCAKYEILRGIYPNNKRLTGDICSCGLDNLLTQSNKRAEQHGIDKLANELLPIESNMVLAYMPEEQAKAFNYSYVSRDQLKENGEL